MSGAAAKAAAAMPIAAISLRSTVWIAVTLALIAAPHAERLPLWLSGLAATFCAWRLYIARMRLELPARWLMVSIVFAGALAIYLQYRTLFGRDAGVALLVLMISLKLMETRTQRDGMMLAFIGYFLVITNFFYSQSIPTALYLLACVWLITATMMGLQYTQPPADTRSQLRTAAVMLAQCVPLMLVFFVLFPRVQGPLWGMPSDAFAGVTGMSDTMSPGTLNKLVYSEDVAFRATFADRVPPQNRLYWRGPVLMDYDGRTWSAAPRAMRNQVELDRRANPVRYTVTLEPHNRRWLFALDMAGLIPPRANLTVDHQLLSQTPVNSRLRYDMESYLDYSFGADGNPNPVRMLAMPRGFNPQTRELGLKLREQYGTNNEAIMSAVLTLLREQKFVYTLEPPLLGAHAVDDFLFKTRAGFCEHFASAFAFLMRSAGVPSRVVTGYLGGEYNALGDYLIVRQSDAHAWTEVWLPNRGWVRVDPTNSVSPARAEGGLAAALPESAVLPRSLLPSTPLFHQLSLTLDSSANAWNQTVLGYNFETQRALLTRAGFDDTSWRTLAIFMIAATGIITLLIALLTLRNRAGQRDFALEAYRQFCDKATRAGIPRRDTEGPLDFARRLAAAKPSAAPAAGAITNLYVALRYDKNNKNNRLQELRKRVRQFAL